jgi:uncharacterized caspase-like protein
MKIIILSIILQIAFLQLFAQNDRKHIALLIGNSKYSKAKVKSPENDALLLAEELKEKGFDVIACTNLTIREMKIQMQEFEDKLKQINGIALFFYSGYGLQFNGQNYLVPIDAQINKEQDIELEAIDIQKLIGEMEIAKNALNLIILDASRENPFSKIVKKKDNGLAIIDPPLGTLVAYSTTPGNYSVENDGDNSLYIRELVRAIKMPGLKMEEIFKKVRKQVYKKTNGLQSTWENSSLFNDFYF